MILTTSEFNNKRDQVLKTFSNLWYTDMISSKWRLSREKPKTNTKLLWLFVWALDTYEHSATAENYITEEQVLLIFKKVNSIQ